ncbi:hypothetical protein CJU90_0740 [Yarrowia sp. C11]|nr:hypothetical protein CKK34_2153 [Yarrowia sp. E02]KAG5373072.1 hypothetical protein CJU90_0740 [Yarrowia sp. C11]
MRGQSEELKDWLETSFLKKFTEHMVMVEKTNLGVELEPEVLRAPSRRHIPSEIVALILSFAEIETAVTLRELNTQWYSMFHTLEPVWKAKMNDRNPWIVPGDGDLKTWKDVALVFGKRLLSSKWQTTEDIDNVEVTGTQIPKRTIVGRELHFGQKLPASFVSMADNTTCRTLVCEHMHFLVPGESHYSMDPWTLETHDEHERFQILSMEAEETVVEVDGIKVTIPTYLFDQGEVADVSVGRSTVYVHLRARGHLMMPRADPHFRLSFYVRSSEPREAGDLTVLKQGDGYTLADFGNRRLLKYTKSRKAAPVALYNGVIWLVRNKNCMIPTFIDLNTPEKLYYRSDRAITGMEIREPKSSQGSRARGSAQFVIGLTGTGLEIVDLVGGCVTSISHHYGYPEQSQCFVGFNEGRFQAWIMHEQDCHLTRRKTLTDNGVDLEREGRRRE